MAFWKGQFMAVSEFVSHHDGGSCHMDVGMCSHPITWRKKAMGPSKADNFLFSCDILN